MEDKTQPSSYRFIILFIVLFAIFECLYFLVPMEYLNKTLYPLLITEPCTAIINFFNGDSSVVARNSFIQSRTANLQIVRGCDGSGVLFLLIAAILAFNTSLKNKLIGVLAGTLFVYIINSIRIIFIYYIVSHYKQYFVEFHSLIAPSIIIILTSIAFVLWANWSYGHYKIKY